MRLSGPSDTHNRHKVSFNKQVEEVMGDNEEIVKALAPAMRVFKEAQIAGHPLEHSLIGLMLPQTRTQAQGAGVVIGGVTALQPR